MSTRKLLDELGMVSFTALDALDEGAVEALVLDSFVQKAEPLWIQLVELSKSGTKPAVAAPAAPVSSGTTPTLAPAAESAPQATPEATAGASKPEAVSIPESKVETLFPPRPPKMAGM